MDIIPWYVTLVRLLVPFLILRWPLSGIFASMLADMGDWKFIDVVTGADSAIYQAWDKIMDIYYWLFILWNVRTWKDIWAKRVAFGLFGYRLIGMIWFWLTGWRQLLFFFPNVFENFAIMCLLIFWITKNKKLKFSSSQKTMMLTILILPKLIHEYFQHFLLRQPWEIYDIEKWLGFSNTAKEHINNIAWGGILYVIPLLGFLFYPDLSQLVLSF